MTGPRAGSIDSIRLQSLQPGLWSRGTMIDLWTNKLAQLTLDILILGGMSDSSSNWLMDSILEIICVIALMAVNLAESKGLIDHSLIIGNLVHTYLAGLIAVFNCWSKPRSWRLWNCRLYCLSNCARLTVTSISFRLSTDRTISLRHLIFISCIYSTKLFHIRYVT